MRYKRSTHAALIALVFTTGCGVSSTSDAGGVDGGLFDAGLRDAEHSDGPDPTLDSGHDADPCIDLSSVDTFRLDIDDDTSLRIRARIAPDIETEPWDLYLWFQRFGDARFDGSVTLGVTPNEGFPDCPHCVIALQGTNLDRGFFAAEGTLDLSGTPFDRRIDLTLRDVVLREVTIDASDEPVPVLRSEWVEGGLCFRLPTIQISQPFPPTGWRCAPELFGDGVVCNCGCGAMDTDCGQRCPFPPDPSCDPTPLPVTGCGAAEVCTNEGECSATCDRMERIPCVTGVCGFDRDGERCLDPATERVDTAALGETCEAGNYLCAVDDDGFTMGVCDDIDAWLCRPICSSDAECPVTDERCYGESPGYCRPPVTDG